MADKNVLFRSTENSPGPTPACDNEKNTGATPCCTSACDAPHWTADYLATRAGKIPQVTTTLNRSDKLGAVKTRLGINRMSYTVPPGLYAVGNPDGDSPVLITANYKLTFDHLRSQLTTVSAWLLVLDTRGINVWCAAGAGTFGTEELIRQLQGNCLSDVVNHRQLIVPQLGAPGIAAGEVKKQTGFTVKYGPVRAADLPAFLAAGCKATAAMRRVEFGMVERAKVIPVEVRLWFKYAAAVIALWVLFSGISAGGFRFAELYTDGLHPVLWVLAGYLSGGVVVPLLLPWVPARAFSIKGGITGFVIACALFAAPTNGGPGNLWHTLAMVLIITAVSSFMALNYTGTATFTSMSGVKKETRRALPAEAIVAVAGTVCWLIANLQAAG